MEGTGLLALLSLIWENLTVRSCRVPTIISDCVEENKLYQTRFSCNPKL